MIPTGGAMPWGFRRFWAGEVVSGFGSWITMVALQALVVTGLHAGTVGSGLLNSARWLPYLLFGIALGALIDRYPRRPVMISTDIVRALLLLLIPMTFYTDALTLPLLLALVALYGTVTLMNDGASQAFVPRLVPRGQLQSAHARIDGSNAVAETAGPAAGGALVALFGALSVGVTAVTYLFSAAMVALIPMKEERRTPTEPPNLRREMAEGLRWVYRGGSLRDLAIWTHVWFAGQAALGAVFPVYVLVTMDRSTFWFGLVLAVAGVGGLLGAIASVPVGRRIGSGRTVILVHAISAVGALCLLAAQAFSPTLGVAVLCLGQAMHGFAMGASNSHEMAYRQSITPDHLQARTNTTMRSMNRAVVVVVAPLAGLVARGIGLTAVMVTSSALFAATAIGLWCSPFRHARLEALG